MSIDQNTPKMSCKEALTLLDQVSESLTYPVWIPSLKGDVLFKEINTKQQKEILQAIVDSPFYKTKFITTFYKIIKDNFMGEEDPDNFTILDKQLILLKTRSICFSPEYTITTDENVNPKVDLNSLYEKSSQSIFDNEIHVLDCGQDIVISVQLPTIKLEFKLEDELHKDLEIMSVNDTNSLRQTLGELFMGEIAKYIISIQIKDSVIDFASFKSFKEKISILEKLPAKAIQSVIEYIDQQKEIIDEIVTVNLKDRVTNKEVKVKIDIDSTFFNTR